MELYKNIVITVVTVLIMSSTSYTILISSRCKKYRKESYRIFPLLMSVFGAGHLRGIACMMVCIICWAELQHLTLLFQVQFVLMWFSIYAQYWSLAMLSAMKSLSVLKPFLYLQAVTRTKILIITLIIWFLSLVSAAPMGLTISMGFNDVIQMPLPGPDGEQLGHLFNVLVYPYFLFNISRLVIVISCVTLLTVTVRQKLQTKHVTNLGSGERAERADEVIRAIWYSKGVLAISVVCVIMYVPVITMTSIPQHLVKQEPKFYCYWLLVSDPFWYSLCVIFTSPTLQKWIISALSVKPNELTIERSS